MSHRPSLRQICVTFTGKHEIFLFFKNIFRLTSIYRYVHVYHAWRAGGRTFLIFWPIHISNHGMFGQTLFLVVVRIIPQKSKPDVFVSTWTSLTLTEEVFWKLLRLNKSSNKASCNLLHPFMFQQVRFFVNYFMH